METREILKRYPRLCAHLICESLGYLTPQGAANMLSCFMQGSEFRCELTSSMENVGVKNPTKSFVKQAIERRKKHKGPMTEIKNAKKIVQMELSNQGLVKFASWF